MFRVALTRAASYSLRASHGVSRHSFVAKAFFSDGTETAAHAKLRDIMEEYRQENFPQELRSRVFKMVLKAADENNDGLISVDEVSNLLERIGASDKLNKGEIEEIMKDLGIDADVGVPMQKVKEFFLPPKK
mmetsp:Transcript_22097/g.36562  ORF Transcript_22097/g.36562 Transcript_22097/m.36562 type:complete len:132 (+) Transcript_22097:104-499(+)